MRKSLLVVWGLFVGSMCANAAAQYMTVEQKNGEKFSFLLDDKPVITYSNGDLVVNGSTATSYAISGVKNYHFTENDQSGVVNLDADVLRIVSVDENTVRVENASAGLQVVLYDAKGVQVLDAVADQAGVATVGLHDKKGVYVLSVGKKSFKLIRK